MNDLIHKASNGRISDMTFVVTTESADRVGDIVMLDGFSTKDFENNPVALVSHDRSQMPIGIWKNFRRVGDALLADLVLAAKGTSRAADLARGLIEQGILRAVSVGFRALAATPMKPTGMRYNKSELMEISLVSVPMNPRAVLVAKSLDMTPGEMKEFFTNPPVDESSEIEKAMALQKERFDAAHRRAVYSLINATRAARKRGEL